MRVKSVGVAALAALLCVASLFSTPSALAAEGAIQHKPLIVFAAASLKNAMDDVARAYDRDHPDSPIKISYAGSSTLARQIEAGAPADVYISANQQWMDQLAHEALIDKTTRYDLLGNSLVLVAPRDSHTHVKLADGIDLTRTMGPGAYLAMANTDAVPAGIYGKQALTALHGWQAVQGHIAQADDVRAALALVSRGESPLGVVYASDAVADHGVRVVDTFPADSHKPIVYPAAAIADSDNPADGAFLDYLRSPPAAAIFKRWGFDVVAR